MKLWSGQTISELCSRITRQGLPLVALLTLKADPVHLGLLAAAGALPALVAGLFAGAWIDRLPRRRVLVAADLGLALLLLTVPLASLAGRLSFSQLYLTVGIFGVFTVFFEVAYLAYLPGLVSREKLLEGNSKLALSSSLAEVAGPGLAGVLIQALTAPLAILIDAVSYLVSAAALVAIRRPEPPLQTPSPGASVFREIREGLHMVFSSRLLRSLALVAATDSFFGSFYAALYSLYAIRTLGMGPAALGFVVAMGGAGELIGAALAPRLARRLRSGAMLVGPLIFGRLAGFLTPLAFGPVPLAVVFLMAGQLLGDGSQAIFSIQEVTLRQSVTPDRLLGRAASSQRFLVLTTLPLGSLAGGLLGQIIGPRLTLLIAATGLALSTLWLFSASLHRVTGSPESQAPHL